MNDKALRNAVGNGHIDIVKYLVEKGANIHVNDYESIASSNGHLEVVEFMTENGIGVNEEASTAAVEARNFSIFPLSNI